MNLLNHMSKVFKAVGAMGYYLEIIDKKGYYVYCSDNCGYDLYKPSDMIGMHATQAYDMSNESSVLIETMRSGKPCRNVIMEYTSRRTSKKHLFMYNAFPMVERGVVIGAIALYCDVVNLENALKHTTDIKKNKQQQAFCSCSSKLFTFSDIIHGCSAMSKAISLSKRVASTDSSVLLSGETGTGKELFAQSIHMASGRNNRPFVAINCGAIPHTLIESILFGSVKGAYTGAVDKKGIFEQAKSGTVFLDEIHALDIEMQSKLLRVLEEKKVRRVGGDDEIEIDVKIISAINENPMKSIRDGKLKPDLFYRIAVVTVEIPQLRRRGDDIELLTSYYINRFNKKMELNIQRCSPTLISALKSYDWPGNVRELRHAIEHAANFIEPDEECLEAEHIPHYILESVTGESRSENFEEVFSFDEEIELGDYKTARQNATEKFTESFNVSFVRKALSQNDGNISKTAKAINLSRQHLHDLISKYDIRL